MGINERQEDPMINKKRRDNPTRRGPRGSRISPALVLSVVALFAALSGAAVALPGSNTVDSGDIKDNKVKSVDIEDGGVRAADLGDLIHVHTDTVSVPGGVNENGTYNTATVNAACANGEELISGSGHWSGEGADEELFLSEIELSHASETVTVRGGNDIGGARTLVAVAHCLSA
jgi:hypothetical protein